MKSETDSYEQKEDEDLTAMSYKRNKETKKKPRQREMSRKTSIMWQTCVMEDTIRQKQGRYACDVCDKRFTRRGDVQRHKNSMHDNQKHDCRPCGMKFAYADALRNHIANVHKAKRYRCGLCDTFFSYASSLRRHLTKLHPGSQPNTAKSSDDGVITPTEDIPPVASPKVTTPPTSLSDQSLPESSTISLLKHTPAGSQAKKPLSDADTIQDMPPDVKKLYTDNWDAIRTHSKINRALSTYTVFHRPTENYTTDWTALLKPIINNQTRQFKINYSHHFVLRNEETQALRFYHASVNNNTVLDMPTRINSKKDFDTFISTIAESQPFEYALRNRPNTKWTVENILATSFYLYHMDFPIA